MSQTKRIERFTCHMPSTEREAPIKGQARRGRRSKAKHSGRRLSQAKNHEAGLSQAKNSGRRSVLKRIELSPCGTGGPTIHEEITTPPLFYHDEGRIPLPRYSELSSDLSKLHSEFSQSFQNAVNVRTERSKSRQSSRIALRALEVLS